MGILMRRNKVETLCRLHHQRLQLGDVIEQHLAELIFQAVAAEHFIILDAVIHLERGEAHQTGKADLTVLFREEILESVVRHLGVFDIDLADDAHLDLGDTVDGNF